KNSDGQLGNRTQIDSNVPVPVYGLSTGVVAVAGATSHSLAVRQDGTLWKWGTPPETNVAILSPLWVPSVSTAVAVSAGEGHSLVLLNDGTVEAWGQNTLGQLGNGTASPSDIPIPVSGISNIVKIA